MPTIEVGSHTVEISHPDKVVYPDVGITKGEVVDFYRRIGDRMVPHLVERPLALHRFPDGLGRGGFFQKAVPDYFPEWIDTVTLERERGGTVTHVVCNDTATLVYLANQNVLVLHRLLVDAGAPRRPTELILDLDPPRDDPAAVVRAARLLRRLLEDLAITGFVKSTGSKGVHVHVPLDGCGDFDALRTLTHELAAELVARDPERLTIEHRKNERGDRLFVDWLRNGYAQHAVAPYTLRALPGAPVAVPLDWDEATSSGFEARRYTPANVFRRLAHKPDPWAEIGEVEYSIGELQGRVRAG